MRRGLFILCGMLLSIPVFASSITVSGSVSGIWSADTVFVAGQVQITPGNTLVIQPGVKVLFLVQAKFIVENSAILTALGTANDSIRFDGYPSGNPWNGIRFVSASDSSRLQYCSLRDGSASGSGDDQFGGAVFCSNSSPLITHCLITTCTAASGGGIYCATNTHPHISYNTISASSANGPYPGANGGGISAAGTSFPEIDHNYLTGNHANINFSGYGGGLYFQGSPNIHDNLITDNIAWAGGGLQGSNAVNVIFHKNKIDNNTGLVGGGIDCIGCTFTSFDLNEFCHNLGTSQAGALFFNSTSPVMNKNTFTDNSAGMSGGLYLFAFSRPTILNSIVWGNSGGAFYMAGNSNATVTYSDVQGGWTGTGNINAAPQFVNETQNDFRLMWGSSCLNSGDPNVLYNDPDGSRADMGAWYFDISHPVRLLLTPYNAPIVIAPGGGSFTYQIQVTNIVNPTLFTTIAAYEVLPNGTTFGPVLGPVQINLGPGITVTRVRNQTVPASAPAGQYLYEAFAVVAMDTSWDSFPFTKAGSGTSQSAGNDWSNTGEDFSSEEITTTGNNYSASFVLYSAYPNPFNPTTEIRYQMPDARKVNLKVYDTAGRLVATLVNGWQEAGSHEVTFDGSKLASGIYLYSLMAGDQVVTGKMVLMK
jgi:hypothetical protein